MRSVCFITSIKALLPALINTYIVDTGADIVRVVDNVFVFWLFCFFTSCISRRTDMKKVKLKNGVLR